MSNPISENVTIGTIGELLVQLRLLQFGVQAAPPLKDSGNDLIAIKGEIFKTVQVKTRPNNEFPRYGLPEYYHIYALVHLHIENANFLLDATDIYLIPREIIESWNHNYSLQDFRISQTHVDILFA